jgi:hypothetical protein
MRNLPFRASNPPPLTHLSNLGSLVPLFWGAESTRSAGAIVVSGATVLSVTHACHAPCSPLSMHHNPHPLSNTHTLTCPTGMTCPSAVPLPPQSQGSPSAQRVHRPQSCPSTVGRPGHRCLQGLACSRLGLHCALGRAAAHTPARRHAGRSGRPPEEPGQQAGSWYIIWAWTRRTNWFPASNKMHSHAMIL